VLALILAIMVLGLRAPQGTEPRSLLPTLPAIATFALSFILIGIYWNNYHHMLRASCGADGRARGANLHLLFWLSLVPSATAWLGQNPTGAAPTVVYTIILFFCAVAYGDGLRIKGRSPNLRQSVGMQVCTNGQRFRREPYRLMGCATVECRLVEGVIHEQR